MEIVSAGDKAGHVPWNWEGKKKGYKKDSMRGLNCEEW